jgi:hypothetical protein
MAGIAQHSMEVINEANEDGESELDVTCDQCACAVRWREVWGLQQSQTAAYTDRAIQETIVGKQGDSIARCPKLLSIKNYVIEIMT